MGGPNEVKGVRHEGSLVSKMHHPKNPFLGSLRLGSQREPRGIPRELRRASSPGPAGEAVRGSTHSQGPACPPSDVQRQPDPSSEAMGPARPALPSTTKLGLWWLFLIPAGEWGWSLGHSVTPVSSHMPQGGNSCSWAGGNRQSRRGSSCSTAGRWGGGDRCVT